MENQIKPHSPLMKIQNDMLVSDLFMEGSKQWDKDKVSNILPNMAQEFFCIKPSLMGAEDKCLAAEQIWSILDEIRISLSSHGGYTNRWEYSHH